jgi:hypothetical protein
MSPSVLYHLRPEAGYEVGRFSKRINNPRRDMYKKARSIYYKYRPSLRGSIFITTLNVIMKGLVIS